MKNFKVSIPTVGWKYYDIKAKDSNEAVRKAYKLAKKDGLVEFDYSCDPEVELITNKKQKEKQQWNANSE